VRTCWSYKQISFGISVYDIPVAAEAVDPPLGSVTLEVLRKSPLKFVAVGLALFGMVSQTPTPPPPVESTDVSTFSKTVPDADSTTVPGSVRTVVVDFPPTTVALVMTCTGTDSTTSALTGAGTIVEVVDRDVSPVKAGTFVEGSVCVFPGIVT